MPPWNRTTGKAARRHPAWALVLAALLLASALIAVPASAGEPLGIKVPVRSDEPHVLQPPFPLDQPIELPPDQQHVFPVVCPASHPYLLRPISWVIVVHVDDRYVPVGPRSGQSVKGFEEDFLPNADGQGGVFSFKVNSTQTNKKMTVGWPYTYCVKSRPPSCERIPGSGERRTFRFHDPIAGLKSIKVTERRNVKLTFNGEPLGGAQVPIQEGTRDPITVEADALVPKAITSATFEATNMHDEVTDCDPLFARLATGRDGLGRVSSGGIAEAERTVTVANGRPGISTLTLTVNGRPRTVALASGEERSCCCRRYSVSRSTSARCVTDSR